MLPTEPCNIEALEGCTVNAVSNYADFKIGATASGAEKAVDGRRLVIDCGADSVKLGFAGLLNPTRCAFLECLNSQGCTQPGCQGRQKGSSEVCGRRDRKLRRFL
jgi:hypothetical protein